MAAALVLATAARLRLNLNSPLWLDESWTGAFASEPNFLALTQQIRDDANAPIYYYLIWLWSQAFGNSNSILHIPSLVFGLITPAVAWLGLRRHRPIVSLAWAVLLATWAPGIGQSGEARCYALLFLVAVIVTIFHVRLLDDPSLRRATIWAAAASSMTLIHYQAGILAVAQGVAFLSFHRMRALRLWPAIISIVPAAAWILWHAPRLAEFTRVDVAWYDRLTIEDLPQLVIYIFGNKGTIIALVVALLVGLVLGSRSLRSDGHEARDRAVLAWAGGAALAAALTCIVLGMIRPTFAIRYLTPFVPGIMLLVVQWVDRPGSAGRNALSCLVCGAAIAVIPTLLDAPSANHRVYSFEAASRWIGESTPRRLVFFWDHPATPVETAAQLDLVGGYFLRRAGHPVSVTPIYPTDTDMNVPIAKAAGGDAAILWLYDTNVHHTSARENLPRLSELGPNIECRNFGAESIGVVACRRSSVQ